MANSTFELFVTTPQGVSIQVDAEEVVVPGTGGAFGILPGHRPLVSALRPGLLRYRSGGQDHVSAIGVGYVEVEDASVRIVANSLCEGANLDTEGLEQASEEASAQLASFEGYQEGEQFEKVRSQEEWVQAKQELARTQR